MFLFPKIHFSEWIKQCIDIWELIPNCQFWDVQWASVLARCIRHHKSLDWEKFMPVLFTRYLNLFEVIGTYHDDLLIYFIIFYIV